MKKYSKVLSSIALAALLMAACGTGDTNNKEVVSGSKGIGYEKPAEEPAEKPDVTTIEEDAIAVEMVAKENADMEYLFKLVNTTDKEIELSFASLQEFDFIIKGLDGKKLHQYSDEMMFGEAFVEKTLPANGELVFEVDLTEVLSHLESGVYSIEIWSSARESDGLRTEIELALSTDTVANITTATALLNGIIDNNSIEMQDAVGNITVYRLSDDVKTYIESIPENEKVTIKYYEENGQLIITSIIVD